VGAVSNLKSQKGFSLISVIVAIGLMGLLSLLFSQMFQGMLTGQNTGRVLSALTTFHEELQADLSNKTACLNTFNGKTIVASTSINITHIKDAANANVYSVGTSYGGGMFKITSMLLTPDADYTGTSGEGTLTITYQAVPQITGVATRVRTVRMSIERELPRNTVTECIAKAKMTDGIWRRQSSTVDNVYFNDGSVGIGTTAPETLLQVDGTITLGTQATRTSSGGRGQLTLKSTYVKTSAGSTTIDWNNGNIQEISSFVCNNSHTVTMDNMEDGAAYSLLLSGDEAHSGKCLFSATGKSFRTAGGNVAPTAVRNVLFTFAVINGTVVYSMMDDLQP
jgi:type II secretory pathway pseudopilin PulG